MRKAVLAGVILAWAAGMPVASAVQAADAAQPVVAQGAYHIGTLRLATQEKQEKRPLLLYLQFRDGKVTRYHAYLPQGQDGKPQRAGPYGLEYHANRIYCWDLRKNGPLQDIRTDPSE